jgi:acetyl-CoA carboxylase biotin carboxyl carrier protein
MAEKKQAPEKQGIDLELIRSLAALLKETDLAEIEIEQNEFRVRVTRSGPVSAPPQQVAYVEAPRAGAAQEAGAAAEAKSLADPARHPGAVKSPMVGTLYRSPDPNSKPFVEVGDQVKQGQTILIVEAMKHMNEVAAPRGGKVVEILVEDGQPVEYGEPLMIIE